MRRMQVPWIVLAFFALVFALVVTAAGVYALLLAYHISSVEHVSTYMANN